MSSSPFRLGVLAALTASLIFASGAALVRTASLGMSAETLTGLRMLLASAAVFLLALAGGSSLQIPRPHRRAVFLVALICFVHFYAFIAALYHTTVLRSLALTYLAPVWTYLAWCLGPGRSCRSGQATRLAGIMLTLTGSGALLLMGAETLEGGINRGDLLALVSGLALAAYHFLGSRLRQHIPLFAYAAWVYLGSALPFLPLYLFGAWSLDMTAHTSLYALLGVALLPTVGGHTLINYSLQAVPAPLVSLISTLEVPGGALLAGIFTGGMPGLSEWLCAALTLSGLLIYYTAELQEKSTSGELVANPVEAEPVSAERRLLRNANITF